MKFVNFYICEIAVKVLFSQSSTIREFDDRFTAPMFGYATWQDYYRDACLHDKIHALKVPVLCLSAADDPFSPYHGKSFPNPLQTIAYFTS